MCTCVYFYAGSDSALRISPGDWDTEKPPASVWGF